MIGKNRKDLQETKVMGKNGIVVKEGVKSVVKKIKDNLCMQTSMVVHLASPYEPHLKILLFHNKFRLS